MAIPESYYSVHPETQQRTFHIDLLSSKEACTKVADYCSYNSKLERLKGIVKGIAAAGSGAILVLISLQIASLASFVFGPLGWIGAAGFAFITLRASAYNFFLEATGHFAYADLLTQQAAAALRRAENDF